MLPQYLCRRQCLLSVIFIGSLMSLYVIIMNRQIDFNKNKVIYTSDGNNIPPGTLNNKHERNNDIKLAKVVNGPKAIKRFVGTLDGVGCNIKDINPFSAEIMKYMHDFGEHKCVISKDIQVSVELNQMHVSGTGVNFVRTRPISDDNKDGFRFEEFMYLLAPKNMATTVNRG